jgi:hypothetical protein
MPKFRGISLDQPLVETGEQGYPGHQEEEKRIHRASTPVPDPKHYLFLRTHIGDKHCHLSLQKRTLRNRR